MSCFPNPSAASPLSPRARKSAAQMSSPSPSASASSLKWLLFPKVLAGIAAGVLLFVLGFSSVEAQVFMNTYTPTVAINGNPPVFVATKNLQTRGVCAVGNGEYAVVSTVEVEISNGDWQPVGQVMIVDEDGIQQRSMTYFTGYIAPLGHTRFNNVVHVPSAQLTIFDSTIETYSSSVVPDTALYKVRRFTGTDDDYTDLKNWEVRDKGVLIIAGARRPYYYYQNELRICGNWQAAYYAVDVNTLELLSTGTFPCNEGDEEAPFDFSEYTSLRFQYQGYEDDHGAIENKVMRQRVAFVGSARVVDKDNLDILVSRSDLYYIATGQDYFGAYPTYPSYLTRTFKGSLADHDFDEEGLDIDVRFRLKDAGPTNDWKYVVCGYTKSQVWNDTINERALLTVEEIP
jgi:hypothetical protein